MKDLNKLVSFYSKRPYVKRHIKEMKEHFNAEKWDLNYTLNREDSGLTNEPQIVYDALLKANGFVVEFCETKRDYIIRKSKRKKK